MRRSVSGMDFSYTVPVYSTRSKRFYNAHGNNVQTRLGGSKHRKGNQQNERFYNWHQRHQEQHEQEFKSSYEQVRKQVGPQNVQNSREHSEKHKLQQQQEILLLLEQVEKHRQRQQRQRTEQAGLQLQSHFQNYYETPQTCLKTELISPKKESTKYFQYPDRAKSIGINMKEEKPQSSHIDDSEKKSEENKSGHDTSATTKALDQIHKVMDEKRYPKKTKKILAVRRRKMNERLNKILAPKSGLIFLHELKPRCTFNVYEQPGSNPPSFVAQVICNDRILGVGEGMSKHCAKNVAAENAIKVLVVETLAQDADNKKKSENDEGSQTYETNYEGPEGLSWTGLASFAMHKLFTEWENQGTELPLSTFQSKRKTKPITPKPPPIKTVLPPNADKMHPSLLLNTMRPGITAVELERTSKDNVSFVTMGFQIDGKTYTGSGSNKKEARKEAAKAALEALHGLKYKDHSRQ